MDNAAMTLPKFRTGRSDGCTILHQDGRFFYRTQTLEGADLLCSAMNALAETGADIPESLNPKSIEAHKPIPMFSDLMEDLKGNCVSTFPNNGLEHVREFTEADICTAQKQAYSQGVEYTMRSLLNRDMLRLNYNDGASPIPSDKDIEEAALKFLQHVISKGNFMDGLSTLANTMRMWRKKGAVIMVDDKPLDIERILFPVACPSCDGEGDIGPEPCRDCQETGRQEPSIQIIRERLERINEKRS